jgi:hypothetical protein
VGVPLFDKLIHVARIDDINPGVDAIGLLAFREVFRTSMLFSPMAYGRCPIRALQYPFFRSLSSSGSVSKLTITNLFDLMSPARFPSALI